MKAGKVSNSILNRSVLKLIKAKNEYVERKPAIGIDCAAIRPKSGQHMLCSVSSGEWPVYRTANNIAACGGTAVAAECCILMPEDFDERVLKGIMKDLNSQCDALGMQISGGHTQVSANVIKPVITVTGIGVSDEADSIVASNIKPNQDIIMTKWIGIGGIRKIAECKRDEILKQYVEDVLDKAIGKESDLSVYPEAQLAIKHGIKAMHDVAEGGIFAALWDMAEAGNVGMDIDFRKIPVKQELIEICELFDINPYELESSGCLLMTSDRDCDIVNILQNNGIPAQIIGRTTDDRARIIRNQDEVRYLDTPNRDELYRFL